MAEHDSPELEALFESISLQARSADAGGTAASAAPSSSIDVPPAADPGIYERIGRLTRQLHDALQGLGYDKMLEDTLHSIPDAKDRLAYVANLTEQAARRVLDSTDIALPMQEAMEKDIASLGERWEGVFANRMDIAGFRQLAHDTRAFLRDAAPARVTGTREQLMAIMMAQDFQDLTGQVLRKIATMAQNLERGLLHVLIEVMPEARRAEVDTLLNGPVVSAHGRDDIVVNQTQVDDLLESLGF